MLRFPPVLAVALTGLLLAAPANADAANKRKPVKRQLTAFSSCSGLASFARKRVRTLGREVLIQRRGGFVAIEGLAGAPMPAAGRDEAGAEGGPAPAASSPMAGADFSGTNVQEEGIDEPDAVKTDGTRLYVAIDGKLRVLDIAGDEPRLVGTLPLEGYGHELLLRGDRLLVLGSAGFGEVIAPGRPDVAVGAPGMNVAQPRTTLLEVDTRELEVVRKLELPGSVVGGRLHGSRARIAISTPTGVASPGEPRYRRWMPTMEVERPSTGVTRRRSLAPCTSVRRPEVFAGLGLLTLLTIDLDEGIDPIDSDAVLADASTVYASANRMYLATERWVEPGVIAEDGAPPGRSTTIHGFDVSKGDETTYVGSGNVRGYLLNQFSLSEHRGALRVATTEDPPWVPGLGPDGESESFVTVLDEAGGRLTKVGRVGGLGKGERIYAVRFVGDVGFVVTFRQTDPLYTLDLADRTAPRVLGELKIPGFSSYLHPIGDSLMLGIGQAANDQGVVQGAQVSLFDVGDLRDPRRLHQKVLGRHASSLAEHDHRAFLWWPATRLLVLPLDDYDETGEGDDFIGAAGLHVDRSGFAEAGRTEHPEVDGYEVGVMRSLVANGRLYTISYFGVQAGRLDTLAGTAWVPFSP